MSPYKKVPKSVTILSLIVILVHFFFQGNFFELTKNATLSVKLSFNNTMYRQIDGVAMGFLFGPALVNIFAGYQETKLFLNVKKPLM